MRLSHYPSNEQGRENSLSRPHAGNSLHSPPLNKVQQGVKSLIIFKTAQNFLKIKFLSGPNVFFQGKAQCQMNRVIDSFLYI